MLDYATVSSRGDRPYNEDFILCDKQNNDFVFALADGLGGHGLGNIASEGACDIIVKSVFQKGMEDSILEVQETLLREQKQNGLEGKMKTTIAVVKITDKHFEQLHLGDSRIYHFSRFRLLSQTKDHSVCQKLVNAGLIDKKALRHHKDRNKLLNVLGMEWNEVKPYEISKGNLSNFEAILLCSDGFWEWIDEKSMKRALLKSSSAKEWLSEMQKIVKNNGMGSDMDNYSAIAIIYKLFG